MSTSIISEDFQPEEKVVLILCGLIASGKSTFAESLEVYFPKFRRCNQDDLGDRRKVEQLARSSLAQGMSVCIDRTNFNASQRSYWIEIAREFPGTLIWVIVFDTPYEICAARLRHRTSHPTIKSPEEGLPILSRFATDFQYPNAREGYDRIIYVKPADHPSVSYSRQDISAFLHRVRNSPPAARRGTWNNSSPRGGYPRGRGRGWIKGSPQPPSMPNEGSTYLPGLSSSFRGWQLSPTRRGFRGAGQYRINTGLESIQPSRSAHSQTPDTHDGGAHDQNTID